ncbi:O-methyltransferase family protein [Staphylococcus epidermidis SK135]|nr:O-methyltransferase family protein [Staphylococcus epidermidis SK135]
MNRTKNILEIGTAIGYSSMQFANISKDINVTTIERNEDMIHLAKKVHKKVSIPESNPFKLNTML